MDARLLITILIGVIWLALRLLRRKPEDTKQQEQRDGDDIFTESEVNVPWEQIPQRRQMLMEYDYDEEEVRPVGRELNLQRVEKKEETPVLQADSPSIPSTKPKRETSQHITPMTSIHKPKVVRNEAISEANTPAYSQKRPKQIRQIAGIPLNTQNVKFGIVLSEILNKPKSQRT